ncbi:hypothetical protein Hamer_G022164 [Homarus americanus]|uniref:Uncharacterized protein n=1 Tax=Homarus americanus TaxID=6706 RepID=A0A8J5JBZ1_HOMAM|nr:hypothetical protein Hamer_G022164 [Homarus americanus]
MLFHDVEQTLLVLLCPQQSGQCTLRVILHKVIGSPHLMPPWNQLRDRERLRLLRRDLRDSLLGDRRCRCGDLLGKMLMIAWVTCVEICEEIFLVICFSCVI